jgi:hypothetical protein
MPGLAERALRIIRERYADFGPTLACEKLAEIHDLYLAKETVRKLMTRDGLWIPRKLRPPRVHQPRPRRACTGELIRLMAVNIAGSRTVVRPARCSFTLMMQQVG